MKLVLRYLREQQKTLFLALFLATVNQAFSLLDPQIFRLIVDNYARKVDTLTHSAFLQGVLFLLLLSVTAAFISRVAKNFQDYYVSVITQRVGAKLYATSIEHSFGLPYAIFEDQRSGELLQKLQKARLDSQTAITSFVNIIFLSLVGIIFVVVYAFTVHWAVGLLYALIIPVLGTATFFIGRKIKLAQKTIVKESANLAGSTTETLRNVELVKSLGLEDQEIRRLNSVNETILGLELKKIKLIRLLSFAQGTLINAMRSILLLLMLYLIFQKNISLGQFFSLFIYSFFIFTPLAEFGTVNAQFQEARASTEQLEDILKIPKEPKPEKPITIEGLHTIEFKNASFHYASATHASLQNINVVLKAHETTAFVGLSGSGKTTLIKLICGLYKPTEGTLLLNNIDAIALDYEKIRKRIGLVSQETQLFAGTIRENLLFVNPEASDTECLKVLKMASAMNIVERADSTGSSQGGKGLDTKIGEGGIKISGGERQRLAIARALLRNPDLIIFDEATSSLDSITEKEITGTIREIEKSRPDIITVLIAHRLSTVAHADVIHVLEKGHIIESGTHEELIKKGGLYAALWREQSGQNQLITP